MHRRQPISRRLYLTARAITQKGASTPKWSYIVHIELLRGFGARVQIDPRGVEIRAGERTLTGKAVGAKFHEYGWWVPLRATAQALGWRVDWLSAKREAVVHAPPAQAAVVPIPRYMYQERNMTNDLSGDFERLFVMPCFTLTPIPLPSREREPTHPLLP